MCAMRASKACMCAQMEGQRKMTQHVHMRTATEAAMTQNKDGLELLQSRVKLFEASAARCSHTHTQRAKLVVEGGASSARFYPSGAKVRRMSARV